MAFGNVITDATQIAASSGGYIARFNLQNIDPRQVKQVQIQNTGTAFSTVVSTAVTQAVLQGYLDDAATEPTPGFAYCLTGRNLDIFLVTASFPYTSVTRVGYSVYRTANNLSANTQNLDIPEKARLLFKLLVMQELYRGNNKAVPQSVLTAISTEKTRLGYT